MLPLLLLWAGPAAILLAHLSLGQFKLFYSTLELAAKRNDGFWQYTQPGGWRVAMRIGLLRITSHFASYSRFCPSIGTSDPFMHCSPPAAFAAAEVMLWVSSSFAASQRQFLQLQPLDLKHTDACHMHMQAGIRLFAKPDSGHSGGSHCPVLAVEQQHVSGRGTETSNLIVSLLLGLADYSQAVLHHSNVNCWP